MRAATARSYGPPDTISVETLDAPVADEGQVLVRVAAAGLNPLDTYITTGRPVVLRLMFGLRRPGRAIVGNDFAGVIESVGAGVSGFAVGDEVWGGHPGSCAELIALAPDRVMPLPDGVSLTQAGGVGVAAVTALQGLRDQVDVQPGQRVLVNGASGGVGTFAVQIAKHIGAEVTGVCSTANVELVASLGADRVIDYTADDFCDADLAGRYDVVLDNIGNRTLREVRRVVVGNGAIVRIGAPKGGPILGPIRSLLVVMVAGRFASQRVLSFTADETPEALRDVNDLLATGAVTPVVDRVYPLDEIGAAMTHLASGRAVGKVIVAP